MFLLNLLHCVTLIDRQSLTWNWHIPDNTTTLYLKNHVKRHKVISVVTVSLGCVSPLTILRSHYITIIVSMWDTLEFFDLVVNIIFVEARGILIFITGPFSSVCLSLLPDANILASSTDGIHGYRINTDSKAVVMYYTNRIYYYDNHIPL